MANLQIPYERLLRQRIAGQGLTSPAAVVRWMGAVQSQDYAAGKWAIGLRMASGTEAELEAAFTSGELIRLHVMRPTWHFIPPEDVRWMQALTSPRVHAQNAYYYRNLELDAALCRRSNAALEKGLRDGKQLTRPELGAVLAKAGIRASGLRLTYIVLRAELDAVICSGRRRGKQFTYGLLAERAPYQRDLGKDEALAVLTERYFTSHGPATVRDYAWWSSLPAADIKRGLEMVKDKLACEEIEGQMYWKSPSASAARFARGAIHLLPNFDEYVVGYTDREAIFDDMHTRYLDIRQSPLAQHIVVSNGRISGTWKRTIGKDAVGLDAKLFAEPKKAEVRSLGLAVKRYSEYLGLPVTDFRF